MKKMTKRMVTLLLVVLLMAAFALPVMAAHCIQWNLTVGESLSLGYSSTPYESSDPDVVRVEFDGDESYTAVAVGEGSAVLTGGYWGGVDREYEITVTEEWSAFDEEYSATRERISETRSRIERSNAILKVVVIIIAVLMGILLIGAVVYIFISAPNPDSCDAAKKCIDDIVFVPEVGALYYGRVVSYLTSKRDGAQMGAFIELAPGKDGLCHIRDLEFKRTEKVEDVVKIGDMTWVKVIEIDEKGRVNLSRKEALREVEAKMAAGEPIK